MRSSFACTLRALLAGAIGVSFPVFAVADVGSVFLSIEATSDLGTDTWELMTDDVNYDSGTDTWSWSGGGYTLNNGTSLIGMIDNVVISMVGDPQINLIFAVQAGNAPTHFVISSSVLSFPGISSAQGVASVGITLTDSSADGSGGTLTGNGPGGGAYQALYNSGSTFAEFVSSISAGAFDSDTENGFTGGLVAIPGTVTDMQAVFDFTVTPQDSASATSTYLIIPEPTAIALLAVGAALALRRR